MGDVHVITQTDYNTEPQWFMYDDRQFLEGSKPQNDLFCLHKLTGDRKQAVHIMLNEFINLERLEHVMKQ